ncbi:MAG: sigma 54-interacting transcriptional regulator [Thermoanaerobaculia bacterium]
MKRDLDYRVVIDTTPTLIFSARPDGYVDYVNRAFLDFFGAPFEDLEGSAWAKFVHPDDLDEHVRRWREALASGAPAVSEARYLTPNGEYRWLLVHTKPLRDDRGEVIRWFGAATDIEHAKRAEETLRNAEKDVRTILETIPAIVWTAQPDGGVDFISQGWTERMGGEKRGWSWTEVVHPDDIERVVYGWREALDSGRPLDHELRLRQRDGDYRWYLVRAVPRRDDAGAILRWYGTITDIDDRKRAEDELRALKDQLYKENIALRDEVTQTSMFEEIVGSSEPLRRVLVLVAKVAGTDSTVLITGETGTGKELIARAIHNRSPRASKAFVSVNCGAIPPSLVGSELFGHEKGSFTGALQRHAGRFEVADGGTIFLDEVGELPPETQIALLRVLQEQTFERVGGNKPIPVDVRVLAATNRDLSAAIDEGSFRRDLYYRLNVFPIHLPPLRDRVEDIPLLVEYLTQRYASKLGKRITSVSRAAIDLLTAYDWPGNIRELQNVIQRAVILCDGTLRVDESWLERRSMRKTADARQLGRPSLREEKEWIESALAEADGRVAGPSGAAARLGIPRSTLESKIRSLRIDKNRFKAKTV